MVNSDISCLRTLITIFLIFEISNLWPKEVIDEYFDKLRKYKYGVSKKEVHQQLKSAAYTHWKISRQTPANNSEWKRRNGNTLGYACAHRREMKANRPDINNNNNNNNSDFCLHYYNNTVYCCLGVTTSTPTDVKLRAWSTGHEVPYKDQPRRSDHNTGNSLPYSLRIVCGFFNVPQLFLQQGLL